MIRLEKEEAQLPGPDRFRIHIHLHCFGDWQGRITVSHVTDGAGGAGLSSSVGRLGLRLFSFRLFNFGRCCGWSLFVLSGNFVTSLAADAFTLRLNTQR